MTPPEPAVSRSVVLVSCYDLGRQPLALATAASRLQAAGHRVTCVDLAVERLDAHADAVAGAEVVAFSVPMHTATRIALRAARVVRELAPRARLVFFGLYAPLNENAFRAAGASAILGIESDAALVRDVDGLGVPAGGDVVSAAHGPLVPLREGLPPLQKYARLVVPGESPRLVGTTEATRGCRHRCRHCPVVAGYDGRVVVVPREVILEDVRRLVDAGAGHVTFADPDFFNGPGHVVPIVEALHEEHPLLSYDVTIKIEHLLQHRRHVETLVRTGCAFVTTAVESIDDAVLARLEKGHTRSGFREAVHIADQAGLPLSPTFIPFSPWTTPGGYVELLDEIEALDLVRNVSPIQLAIRLLITARSRLLELQDVREMVGPFDPESLAHPWEHADPRVDALQRDVMGLVMDASRVPRDSSHASGSPEREPHGEDGDRELLFAAVRERARTVAECAGSRELTLPGAATEAPRRAPVPYLTEPWYC